MPLLMLNTYENDEKWMNVRYLVQYRVLYPLVENRSLGTMKWPKPQLEVLNTNHCSSMRFFLLFMVLSCSFFRAERQRGEKVLYMARLISSRANGHSSHSQLYL